MDSSGGPFAPMPTVFVDIEVYPGFFFVGAKRDDGKIAQFELSDRSELDIPRLRNLMFSNTIITFNGLTFDVPLICAALEGANTEKLKLYADRIIKGGLRWWDVEREIGVKIPRRIDHIDLIEPQPNAVASLKILNGRLHGRRMQDLPYEPDRHLTDDERDEVIDYCLNSDIPATERLYHSLKEPLDLRRALSAEYKVDFRSKSDSQIGETIVKKLAEAASGKKVSRIDLPPGTNFRYVPPDFIRFERADLQALVETLRTTDFFILRNRKIDFPPWLSKYKVTIGNSTYAMGIGGLHSTERNRAVHSTDDAVLIDADVASQYPSIIIKLGLFPPAIGPTFRPVYQGIVAERLAAKAAGIKAKADGLKIAANGVYGKLNSPYSVLYAPSLMLATTLTGQLTLLMLAERAEDRGISVVSGNTDGVLFLCPRELGELVVIDKKTVPKPGSALEEVVRSWEADTGFTLEFAEYRSVYSQSVNSYIAIKPDGSTKRKGEVANPRMTGDMRGQLMKNPDADICSDAVAEFLANGTPIEETIRGSTDIRDFVLVTTVTGGATWRGKYLGKVVRFVWAVGGEPILRCNAHPTTGNHAQVSRSEGARPLMDLPATFPEDIDYDRYIGEAQRLLISVGAADAPPKRRRLTKADTQVYRSWLQAALYD